MNKLNLPGKALDNCQRTPLCCSNSLTGHLYKVFILIMAEFLEDYGYLYQSHLKKAQRSPLEKKSLKLLGIPLLLLNKII